MAERNEKEKKEEEEEEEEEVYRKRGEGGKEIQTFAVKFMAVLIEVPKSPN